MKCILSYEAARIPEAVNLFLQGHAEVMEVDPHLQLFQNNADNQMFQGGCMDIQRNLVPYVARIFQLRGRCEEGDRFEAQKAYNFFNPETGLKWR